MGKCSNIRRIVRFRQMLLAWRVKATSPAPSHRSPPDVPPGHVAICVGTGCRRFIVRATYLNHPVFRRLLSQVEEEYGFSNNAGPLMIPCDEKLFEETLQLITHGESANSDFQRCCNAGVRNQNSDCFADSRPLLYGFTA